MNVALFMVSYSFYSQGLKVLNGGKRLVKMMKQFLPLLILRRLSKANGVVFKGFPVYQ